VVTVLAFLVRPEWWNWAMFVIVPLLLIVLGVALWAILSGLAGLSRSTPSNGRAIPDIMAFLKERYSRKPRPSLYDEARRPMIRK